ncbi:MAG: hypothetical protein MPJ24_11270, partial [Pirellulaceae bacterium]|nr:hypothetical protein [Pirellulaceae bacterium]
ISASGGSLSGTTLATLALVLGAFWSSFGITQSYSRTQSIQKEAEQFAVQWMELVKTGDVYTAFQLSRKYKGRLRQDQFMDFEPSNPNWRGLDVIQGLNEVDFLTRHQPEIRRTEKTFFKSISHRGVDEIQLGYQLTTDNKTIETTIVVERQIDETGNPQWRFAKFTK